MEDEKDPLGILKPKSQTTVETTEEKDPLGILKKKESTELSQKDGGVDSQAPAEQPIKPTVKSTTEEEDVQKERAKAIQADVFPKAPYKPTERQKATSSKTIADVKIERTKSPEQVRDEQSKEQAVKSFASGAEARQVDDPITAMSNTIFSGISDQLPKEYAAQRLRMSKGSFGDIFNPRSNVSQFGDKLPESVSRREFNLWNNKQPSDVRGKSYDEKAKMFLTEKFGADGFEKLKSQFEEKNLQDRKGFEADIQQQNQEASFKTKGVVQDLKQVKGAGDFLNFAGNMIGQALYRAPLSLATGTAGNIVAESAAVYDRQLDLIAQNKGITRDQVIEQGLDKPAEGQALAVLAGTLDAASNLNLLGFFKSAAKGALTEKGVKEFTKNFLKKGVPEGATEAVQSELEEKGATMGAGTEYEWDPWRSFTSGVGGILGGGIIGTMANVVDAGKSIPEVITEATNQADVNDVASVDQQAERIQAKVESQEPKINERQEETTNQPLGEGVEQSGQGSIDIAPEQAEVNVQETAIQPEDSQQQIGGIEDTAEQIDVVQSSAGEQTLYTNKDFLESIKNDKGTGGIGTRDTAITAKLKNEIPDQSTIEFFAEKKRMGVWDAKRGLIIDKNGNPWGAIPILNDKDGYIKVVTSKQIQNPSVTKEQKIEEVLPQKAPETAAPVLAETELKKYAIADRILKSDANEAIKKGVKEKGADYIPKKLDITDSEAKSLIDLYGEDKSEALIRDTKNDLTGDTRTALSARLYENYKNRADATTDLQEKQRLYDKAVDVALTSAEFLKESGRASNAAKIWKQITSSEDMTVLAIEKENKRQAKQIIAPIQKDVTMASAAFDEQIRKLIAQKVTEGVESNLKRAKLITKEKKAEINNFFDSLKVKDVDGAANDITRVLGAAVWNGSLEAVKRAILAGADVANAVQAGIDYIKDNYKGDFNEDDYRTTIQPGVEQMVPKEKITVDQIDEAKINTPKISGRKKKEFIGEVVDAYNAGKLTDERFEELYAKKIGYKELTSEDRQKIRELAKTIVEVDKFEEQVKNDFTSENISKYKSLLDKAQKANDDLQQYAQKPSNIWDTLISIMQGNLLSTLSLVTNVYSNTVLQPLRFFSTSFGAVVDRSVSQLAKTSLLNDSYKDKTIDLTELQKGYFTGAWNGALEGLKQLKTGTKADERNLREINNQFSPVRAIARWAEKERTVDQKINDYVEGTLGWPAEVMFRLLNTGDKPFRRAAEMARALEIAKQKGLTGNDLKKFIMFPDAESATLIDKAGKEATFQQESASAKIVQNVISKILDAIGNTPVIGGPLKLVAKSQIPFVKTPWNIMVETLDYAIPPLTIGRGIYNIKKGNKREGSVLIGKGITGLIIAAVAKELFINGLMSWDEKDKEGKFRERQQLQYDNIPPNSLNISAIQRGLIGEGFEIKDGDTWINYTKLGVMGLLFDNYANNYFSNIKEKGLMPEQQEYWVDLFKTAPSVLSQSLDQSFLKGTNSLLNAIQDGGGKKTEQWIIETTGALSSIVYPNTFATVSKSADEFVRDTQSDEFVEKLKNAYKVKLFLGDRLPPKVNLWGEKITGQPEGRNKFMYYLFDPSKFKEVDTESFKYKLYSEWKGDNFNDEWLPSIPQREISYRKVKIPLDSKQYEEFATYVGEERYNLVSTYMNSAAFKVHDREKKIEKLKDLYQEGRDRGKKRFLMKSGWNVMTPDKLSQIGKKD